MESISNLTNWRYERKFFISHMARHNVENIVKSHPSMFSEIHYQRNVNNIYFDTYAMTQFFKSVDGQSNRIKTRIRWYGAAYGIVDTPVLELKIKKGLTGSKLAFRLNSFSINKNLSDAVVKEAIEQSDIPDDVKDMMRVLNMALMNSYTRKYYQSLDKRYRLTIDTDMKFVEVFPCFNTFSNELNDRINTVLELKYDVTADDDAANITKYFPFRLTKSSKYVTGIHYILGTMV